MNTRVQERCSSRRSKMTPTTTSLISSSSISTSSATFHTIAAIHPSSPRVLCVSPAAAKLHGVQVTASGRRGPWGSVLHGSPCIIPGELRKRDRSTAVESSSEGISVDTSQPVSTIDEEDRVYVEQISKILEKLRTTRDMSPHEVRLTVMIEDPREVERRRQLGIEDERGCSRDDMADALLDVIEGRIPKDRSVLRELAKEMSLWPRLEDDMTLERRAPKQSPYAKVTDTGVDPSIAAQRARVDWDAAAKINPEDGVQDRGETLPRVFGFSFLYLVSLVPIVIGVGVVVILFVNSLQ